LLTTASLDPKVRTQLAGIRALCGAPSLLAFRLVRFRRNARELKPCGEGPRWADWVEEVGDYGMVKTTFD
jgi:hypothetical protein